MDNPKISFLRKTIAEESANPFAHFALAREYQKAGDLPAARDQFRHLIQNFPDYGGTYYHYANFLLDNGEMETARTVMEQGVAVLRKSNEIHLLNELIFLRDQHFDPE